MSAAELRHTSSPSHTYLLVPILLLFGLLVIATLRAPNLISNAGIGSAIIVASPLILATYALTVTAMAGRVSVDLSIGPLIGFINVSMVQLYAAKIIVTPVEFFAYAIAVGVLYQLLMGLIIVYVRVQPIIVALSGFLALVGLNLVILRRPGGVVPEWMQPLGPGHGNPVSGPRHCGRCNPRLVRSDPHCLFRPSPADGGGRAHSLRQRRAH